MATTLEQVQKDYESHRKLCRHQLGVLVRAEKYVEDIGLLLKKLGELPVAPKTKTEKKPKTPKASTEILTE